MTKREKLIESGFKVSDNYTVFEFGNYKGETFKAHVREDRDVIKVDLPETLEVGQKAFVVTLDEFLQVVKLL